MIKVFIKKTINNVKLEEFEKIYNIFISHHKTKCDLYFVNCELKIKFHNIFTTKIEANFF